MGLSMGGLVARYALAQMTKTNVSTETKLLITHDSPHRGANIPLGLQYLIRMMGGFQLFGYNVYDIYPDYNDAISLLNAPATDQLLLYRSVTANTFATNTFLDGVYRNMITFSPADPQPSYSFIATSQGNECARNLFDPGKTFVNLGAGVSAGIDARMLFFRVPIVSYRLAAEVEAYALPNTGSANKIARLYTINNLRLFGFINIVKQLYNNTAYAPGNHLAIDGVPGSYYPLLDVKALQQLTNLPTFNPISLYVQFPLGPFLSGYFGSYAYNSGASFNFTFVSVGSALDVSPYNANTFSEKYVNGVNQNYPSSSQTFIAQESVTSQSLYNNVHIRFTARNSRWMYNEMEGLPNNENCSGECIPILIISGPDLICTSSTYQIPNLNAGTVTWSSSPANIVLITPVGNGYQATISRITDGNVTITATTNCGQPISKAIHVGGYNSSDYPVSGPSSSCANQTVYFSTNTLPGATNYNWFWPFDWSYVSGQGTPYLSLRTSTNSGAVGVRVANSCNSGGSPGTKYTQIFNCGFAFTVSPNPANTTIKVASANLPPQKGVTSTNTTNSFTIIQIVDKMGNIKQQNKFVANTTQATVNISQLSPDIYIVKIFNGKTWEEQRIVVVR